MEQQRSNETPVDFQKISQQILEYSTNHEKTKYLPSIRNIRSFVAKLLHLLFPKYHYETLQIEKTLAQSIPNIMEEAYGILYKEIERAIEFNNQQSSQSSVEALTTQFFNQLPNIRGILEKDIEEMMNHDPAAKGKEEIILAYPGFEALTVHRLAHTLHKFDIPLIPRIMSEIVHSRTGIDIHPGASIAPYCSIDHGTGLIIGETTVIGEHVNLYHNVTLGARSVTPEFRGKKRHPSIEDHVIIYPGATVLGNIIVGANSVIGGNSFLLESCPPNSKIYAKPPKMIFKSK